MDRSGEIGVTAAQLEQFYAELKAYSDWCAAEVPAPFADKTDAVIAARLLFKMCSMALKHHEAEDVL